MSQFPPVGDIKLTKVANTYNTYRMEISFGQLEVIRSALEAQHAEPIADELLAMLDYYTKNLPGPGEEKEDIDAREQAAQGAEEDFPIPMPPGQETAEGPEAGATDQLPELPGEEGQGEEEMGGEEAVPNPEGAEEMGGAEEPAPPEGGGGEAPVEGEDEFPEMGEESPEEVADRHVPAPPGR